MVGAVLGTLLAWATKLWHWWCFVKRDGLVAILFRRGLEARLLVLQLCHELSPFYCLSSVCEFRGRCSTLGMFSACCRH